MTFNTKSFDFYNCNDINITIRDMEMNHSIFLAQNSSILTLINHIVAFSNNSAQIGAGLLILEVF